jgi:acyl-coenzyme A synthetase/AMP-(fatty) acid ligase/acyl carrier protein
MLARRLAESGATFLQATPATWRLLLDAGWHGSPNLTMLCGGEALPRDLANRLLGKRAALWNMYGPTETTIWSAATRVEAGDGPVTIGRPIANTQLYVLDGNLRPVPVGIVGELYIGGDGLARGYHGRPDLTAERFVPDPFSGRPGARLYRTGDQVRYQPDGNIEFLGRADHQVKIRGFRIELGDIEAALSGHAMIRQTVVIAVNDPVGGKSLAAYLVAHPGQQPTPRDLRSFLRERLPTYMVPSTFFLLDSLPLNFSGKIDRRLLPDARQLAPMIEEQEAGSLSTPAEHAIAEVYREILGAQVGSHDTFIDLGGDSLQVIEVIARLEKQLGVRLAPREILLQTVGQLALTCEESTAASRPSRPSVFRTMVSALWKKVRNVATGGHAYTASLSREQRS